MVWYPTPDYVISVDQLALDLTRDREKHPFKLLSTREGLQSLIDRIKDHEGMGLTYQAARFMKDVLILHPFDGGNHRTAYMTADNFLKKNGMKVRAADRQISEPFVKSVPEKSYEEIQAWILEYMVVT